MATIQVFYRTHPGGNSKARPAGFSRAAAFDSLRRSLELSGAAWNVVLVADGGLPADLEALVGDVFEVVHVEGGAAASSLRACLRLARDRLRTADADCIAWFAEDDYLYVEHAFRELVEAVEVLPRCDYFSLYTADGDAWHAAHPSQPSRSVEPFSGGPVTTQRARWVRSRGTTSTFGVRRAAFLADAWLLDLGTRVGAPFDGATWHALQGIEPFSWRHLHRDLYASWSGRGLAKALGKPPLRAVLNVASAHQRRRGRTLAAPAEDLAVHLETDSLRGSREGEWSREVQEALARTRARQAGAAVRGEA